MKTFQEFWPFYLSEHSLPVTRRLHFAGSTLGLAFVGSAIATRNGWLALGALVSGYAFAWIGHFGFEKNRPATFKYPLWSFIADWKMYGLWVSGRLEAELSRLAVRARA
jgi:hypothetical protein